MKVSIFVAFKILAWQLDFRISASNATTTISQPVKASALMQNFSKKIHPQSSYFSLKIMNIFITDANVGNLTQEKFNDKF